MRNIFTLALIMFLAACNVLPEREPIDLYELPASTVRTATGGDGVDSLRIDRPVTSEALSGSRMLVALSDGQIQALPQARWTAPVPLLWRDWVLDAFWRDGRVAGLSAASEGLQSRLELGGMLRAFQIEDGASPQALIQYDALLISTSDRRIIASRRFEEREPLNTIEPAESTRALGAAADRLARDLIDWVVLQSQPGATGEPTAQRRVSFSCENGEEIEVRFFALQGVAVLVRQGETHELQQQRMASGFYYTNGPMSVRGQGDELRLEIGRRAPIQCRAA